MSPAAGASAALKAHPRCLDAASAGSIDAICFAPLNKSSLKMAGMKFPDELHFFADYLKVASNVGELNTLGNLWTFSHFFSCSAQRRCGVRYPGADIGPQSSCFTRPCALAVFERPRVAVAALNPHAGEGGSCGREEIDVISPALDEAERTWVSCCGPVSQPIPFFSKARDGQYDGIVTMYHDQGQIAVKLLGFERGVTIQGGLPIAITTPAHGTAFDIAGQNKANVEATVQAFLIACRMGASHQAKA